MAELLQQLILDTLHTQSTLTDTRTLTIPGQSSPATSHDAQITILGVLNSLLSREMITYETHEVSSHVLTPEGVQIVREGSHEARVWAALPERGAGAPLGAQDLKKAVGDDAAKVGQGRAFKSGWIAKEGNGFVKAVSTIKDTTKIELCEVESSGTLAAGEKALAELRKRKLIIQRKGQWFTVHKGTNFSTSIAKPETDLTVDMLTSGSWKNSSFKKYNFDADGIPTSGGALHPILKVREEIRSIFLEMGFEEMPTGTFVESGFWCFDALFVPQLHPARELQDTFYLSDPSTSLPPPSAYYDRVARVHEHGGYGSVGYRTPWSHEESHKLLLRTHTTASSAAMLYKLAAKCRGEDVDGDLSSKSQSGAASPGDDGFRPAKLFSIDRVFRNETMDATHLAEFHQVEGVVADRNLTLADLIGFMRTFFRKMGMTNLRFKPAYNPYTEPSLEIFAWHPLLEKWVEIGNSGMFRPEMLAPMGFPPDVRVHGWGIGLERPTMIRYGVNNIRSLVGHKTSIENVENSPAVMF
ncbi:tRNA synthetases class II core domain (F)-domain-containing protein [Suillus paluster]|uniref:tRNA synthetases class II core domain (F)-domain-containing protein n=1 Tax=Suillus paluster TaxID=48578 RepID=UPI001B86AC81|nr:tRNA synthetases class II core domain (F)-domain-containing protein [Suillus paluster]KAG1752654.1 tRNA synthetases class II core domain (F)-domain-containing protein [Suillus paluster]